MELRRRTCPGRVELLDHDGRAERAAACAARRRRVDRRRSLLRWFAGDAVGAQPNGKPVDLRPSSSEAEAIILEGTAEYVTDPSHSLAAQSMAASRGKVPAVLFGKRRLIPAVLGSAP